MRVVRYWWKTTGNLPATFDADSGVGIHTRVFASVLCLSSDRLNWTRRYGSEQRISKICLPATGANRFENNLNFQFRSVTEPVRSWYKLNRTNLWLAGGGTKLEDWFAFLPAQLFSSAGRKACLLKSPKAGGGLRGLSSRIFTLRRRRGKKKQARAVFFGYIRVTGRSHVTRLHHRAIIPSTGEIPDWF